MEEFEKYAYENGFQLKLGRWEFIYSEGCRKLTIPVEMLMKGDCLWELSKSNIERWDAPFSVEGIGESQAEEILKRIEHYIELTGKKLRIV